MAQCAAITETGSPCRAQALKGGKLCFTHAPESSAERARAHRLGGQRRRVGHAGEVGLVPAQVRTSTDVLTVLDYSLQEVLAIENSISRGRLLVALCAVYTQTIRTIEFERRIRSLEDRFAEPKATK